MSIAVERPKLRESKAMCPSAQCEPGATLLGVVGEDGAVSYAKDRIEIDQDFIDRVSKEGTPEARYRFANTCVEHQCVQWNGTRCAVPKTVSRFLGSGEGTASLQPCSIRPACRWFRQEGPSACRICPGVISKTPASITLGKMFASLPPEVVPTLISFFGLSDLPGDGPMENGAKAAAGHRVEQLKQQERTGSADRIVSR